MGVMLQLKDKGYKVVGPVNGPNEGYPEYEVPKALLQLLQTGSLSEPAPNHAQLAMRRLESEPAPSAIDPLLLAQAKQAAQTSNNSDTLFLGDVDMTDGVTIVQPIASQDDGQTNDFDDGSGARPITPPNIDAGSNQAGTPERQLRNRGQAKSSRPQRGNGKKKKLTDDDRAAMEAQNMVQSGSRKRKPTQRK
jgi:hypothetical protein